MSTSDRAGGKLGLESYGFERYWKQLDVDCYPGLFEMVEQVYKHGWHLLMTRLLDEHVCCVLKPDVCPEPCFSPLQGRPLGL